MNSGLEGGGNLISKIRAFLALHPGSSARQIKVGISALNKTEVNSCLYANIDVVFKKIGEAPPLWWNTGDPSMGQQTLDLEVISNEDFFSNPELASASDHDTIEVDDSEPVLEDEISATSSNNAPQRFSVCNKCGQVIGSKGHCGCQ
jgi:hypothetical protein